MIIDKNEIKNKLPQILKYYGAYPLKENATIWRCVDSRHSNNPENNLSVKNGQCCCHCGLQGDSIAVIAEMECLNYRDKNDFRKILKKGAEILNMPINENRHIKYKNPGKSKQSNLGKTTNVDLTKIITQKFKQAKKGDYQYFFNRGISVELIRKHKILVGDPTKIFPKEVIPQLNNIWSYRYIIPVWENGKVVNCILRRDDNKSKSNNKTINLKGLQLKFIGEDLLKEKQDYLFICEGWADALSFETLGYKSISINSVVMINNLTNKILENIDNFKDTKINIIFDNDEAGKKYSKKLKMKLKFYKLKVSNYFLKDFKDINDFYVSDSKQFIERIEKTLVK